MDEKTKNAIFRHNEKVYRSRNLLYTILFLICYLGFFSWLLVRATDKYELAPKVVSVISPWDYQPKK